MLKILFSFLVFVVQSCVSIPEKNDDFAAKQGLVRSEVQGSKFVHTVYSTSGKHEGEWHVYIEGDGLPWIQNKYVAKNPTIARPLMLRLLELDSAPVIYLGRPCYNIHKQVDVCQNPWHWTHGRYSELVVESMTEALNKLIKEKKIDKLFLYGHSGGGTIAMLMAPKIEGVARVVTLAGNLDIDAWAEKHKYSPLIGSQNPSDNISLYSKISQDHYIGSADSVILVDWLNPFVAEQTDASIHVIDGVGHSCCWEFVWDTVLNGELLN